MKGRERGQARVIPCKSICDLLGLLGGQIRLEILASLAESGKDVSALAEALELSLGTVSHNLCLLRQHALVEVEQIKKHRVYCLSERIHAAAQDEVIHLGSSSLDGDWLLLGTRLGNGGSTLSSDQGAASSLQVAQSRCRSAEELLRLFSHLASPAIIAGQDSQKVAKARLLPPGPRLPTRFGRS